MIRRVCVVHSLFFQCHILHIFTAAYNEDQHQEPDETYSTWEFDQPSESTSHRQHYDGASYQILRDRPGIHNHETRGFYRWC